MRKKAILFIIMAGSSSHDDIYMMMESFQPASLEVFHYERKYSLWKHFTSSRFRRHLPGRPERSRAYLLDGDVADYEPPSPAI